MRTIIDIPEQQIIPLDKLAEGEGVSRAEMVRRAVDLLLAQEKTKRKKVTLDDAFGICRGTGDFDGLDGLAYQRRIRAEWNERDRRIDIRLGRITPGRKPRKKK